MAIYRAYARPERHQPKPGSLQYSKPLAWNQKMGGHRFPATWHMVENTESC
jgi:hypothetical protein